MFTSNEPMKKIVITLIIISSCIFSCTEPEKTTTKKNDLAISGIHGKVKSIESEIFKLIQEKDSFTIGNKINGFAADRNALLEFNTEGNLHSYKEFYANGKVSKEYAYTYDDKNRLKERNETDHYGVGSYTNYELMYDTNDSIIRVKITDKQYSRVDVIERNEAHYPITKKIIINDTIYSTFQLVYDANNNVIKESEFGYKNQPVRFIKRTFNKQNLKLKEEVEQYTNTDTISFANTFAYDSNQNLSLAKYNIERDTIYMEVKNSYHDNGKLKQTVHTPYGNRDILIMSQKFDENGELIEYARIADDSRKGTWTHEYLYDNQNNWTQKIDYKDGSPLKMTKRTITYYE